MSTALHPNPDDDRAVDEGAPPMWLTDDLDELAPLPAVTRREARPAADAAPVRVLIADDDEVLGHILAYPLAEAGWEVTRVGDGVAARAALARERFDLVVVDLNLPHVNAFELLEALAPRESERHERVVVMSEQSQDAKVIRAFGLGAHDFLDKPLNPRVALSRFRRLLERG